jgi:hypothetical protein
MAFGIILYDEDRQIVGVDDAAAAIFRRPSRAVLGLNLYAFIPRPDRAQMAAAKATFERFGEASGEYAIEREDGSHQSVVYRVLANRPISRLNMMAVAPTDAALGNDADRLRRVGQDLFAGLDVSANEGWIGAGPLRVRGAPRTAAPTEATSPVVAAVFPTEEDARAALLTAQPRMVAGPEMGLTSFDGGWPRDQRSVLAIRGGEGDGAVIRAIVAEFGGILLSGDATS